MKALLYILCFISLVSYAQETNEVKEEFIPIVIEEKEAFISTKTGEYTYREHAITDPTQLQTTASGVVYKDIKLHTVKKKETLSSISREHNISVSELKKDNKLEGNDLKIGQDLKIIKRLLVTSSSPVIGYAGEERVLAKLRPGQTPGELNPPPPPSEIKVTKTAKTTNAKPAAGVTPTVKVTQTDDLFQDLTTMDSSKNETVNTTVIKEEVPKVEVPKVERPKVIVKKVKETVATTVKTKETKVDPVVKKVEKQIKNTETTKSEAEKVAIAEVKTPKVDRPKIEKTEIKKRTEAEEETTKTYIVAKGDTLYAIAKKHKMTIIALKKLNNLTSSNLSIGQKLMVK